MKNCAIQKICAREILDSRGMPTVEACVTLEDGTTGVASVPSGASTGQYEAYELRDGNSRYMGAGTLIAVSNVCKKISPALEGIKATSTKEIDMILCELDGRSWSQRGTRRFFGICKSRCQFFENAFVQIYRRLLVCQTPDPYDEYSKWGSTCDE